MDIGIDITRSPGGSQERVDLLADHIPEECDDELCLSLISGLGCHDEETCVYMLQEDTIDCLKDLQRMLREDGPRFKLCRRKLGTHQIASTNLAPIIVQHASDSDLVFNALKVATFLTMPLTPGELSFNIQDELVLHMQQAKNALMAADVLSSLVALLIEPLEKHPRMSEREALIVQLVLTFLRNLLLVPDARGTGGSRAHHTSHLQEQLLVRFLDQGILELLLNLCGYAHQSPIKKDIALLLHILTAVFADINPQDLLHASDAPMSDTHQPSHISTTKAGDGDKVSTTTHKATGQSHSTAQHGGNRSTLSQRVRAQRAAAGGTDRDRLFMLQAQQAMARMKTTTTARHAHFGATYVQKHVADDHVSVLRAPKPKNTAAVDIQPVITHQEPTPKLSHTLLQRLQTVVEEFLQGSYAILMTQLRKELQPGLHVSRLDRDDFVRFLRLTRFFHQYVRLKTEAQLQAHLKAVQHAKQTGAPVPTWPPSNRDEAPMQDDTAAPSPSSPFAGVSATSGYDTFHLVMMLWQSQFGNNVNSVDWELQDTSLSVLREMLMLLDLASRAGNGEDRRAADRLQRRLLHDDTSDSGLLPVLKSLIKHYNSKFQSRHVAVELVETLHVVLRMLQRVCQAEAGKFLVKKVKRAGGGGGGRRKPKTPNDTDNENAQHGQDQEGGNEAIEQGKQGEKGEGTSGVSDEDGKGHDGHDDSDGDNDDDDDDDGDYVRRPVERVNPLEALEAEERARVTVEVTLDLNKRLLDFADAKVVQLYTWLLEGYATNTTFLNHVLVSFLQRITHPTRGHNLAPMLYHVRVLRTLCAILNDTSHRRAKQHVALLQWAASVVRGLFSLLMPPALANPPVMSEQGGGAERVVEEQGAGTDAVGGAGNEDGNEDGDLVVVGSGGDGGVGMDMEEGMGEHGMVRATSAEEAQEKYQQALEQYEAKKKVQEELVRTMFVEMLFYKGPKNAEYIRDGYKALAVFDEPHHPSNMHGATWGDDDADALPAATAVDGVGGGIGVGGGTKARKKGDLLPEQVESMVNHYEEYGTRRDWLDAITNALQAEVPPGEPSVKRAAVARQLKAMGLKRGGCTERQMESLRMLWQTYGKARGAVIKMCAAMDNHWSTSQMSRNLKAMGLLGVAKSAKANRLDALSDDDDLSENDDGRGAAGSDNEGPVHGGLSSGSEEEDECNDDDVSDADDQEEQLVQKNQGEDGHEKENAQPAAQGDSVPRAPRPPKEKSKKRKSTSLAMQESGESLPSADADARIKALALLRQKRMMAVLADGGLPATQELGATPMDDDAPSASPLSDRENQDVSNQPTVRKGGRLRKRTAVDEAEVMVPMAINDDLDDF